MRLTTTRFFKIGQLLALTIILQGMPIVAAGGSEAWSDKEHTTFAEEVLSSINALRAKLNTEPVLQLDTDDERSRKGLNGIARMYAKLMWTKGTTPLSVPLQSSVVQVIWEESKKSSTEIQELLKSGILYYDSNTKHISGSTLVQLVDKTLKKTMSAGTNDFALKGDQLTDDPANCNALIKLLRPRTKKIGVSAFWNANDEKQTYVILFEHDEKTPGKLTSEAIKFLDSQKCPKGPVKPLSDNALVTVIEKAINDFRKEADPNLSPLKWTAGSGLMELSNAYAFDWAEKGKPASIPEPHILFTDSDVYSHTRWEDEKLKVARTAGMLALDEARERTNNGMYAHIASKLIEKLIKADREKVAMPGADSQTALPRISQLLCKDATEFGYFATSYEFKTAIDAAAANPIGSNFYVLLFDKKCDTPPNLSPAVKKAFRVNRKIEF